MIKFTQYEKDVKLRVKELTLFKGRLLLIAQIIALILTICFWLISLINTESNMLKWAILSGVLCGLCVVFYLGIYYTHKRAIATTFKEYAVDGKIDFTLEKIDCDKILFTRVNDNKKFEINKTQIKSVHKSKNVILIILYGKKWLDLPRNTKTNEFIKSFYFDNKERKNETT